MNGSLFSSSRTRVVEALARYLAEPVGRRAASADVRALSGVLRPGDVILTEGNTRVAALVRRVTRSPWAHVSIYVGPLEAGDDPHCVVEAHISTGVRAVPLSQFQGQRARIVRPLVQAFLFVGHPIATSQAHDVLPGDFESAAGFEVVQAPPG